MAPEPNNSVFKRGQITHTHTHPCREKEQQPIVVSALSHSNHPCQALDITEQAPHIPSVTCPTFLNHRIMRYNGYLGMQQWKPETLRQAKLPAESRSDSYGEEFQTQLSC